MKRQSNGAAIWIISLIIAIPLFIVLAGLNAVLAILNWLSRSSLEV